MAYKFNSRLEGNIMNKIIILALLTAPLLNAESFGINLGPFSLQFNIDGTFYRDDHRDILDSPICYAIANQKRIDVIVEGKEKISPNEFRITRKRIVIEPYAFGFTKENSPVLRGNIIHEKLIKEVTIKYGDEKFMSTDAIENKAEGYFTGWLKSDQNETVDISRISNLYVINESRFDAPKDYKGFQDDSIRVICEIGDIK